MVTHLERSEDSALKNSKILHAKRSITPTKTNQRDEKIKNVSPNLTSRKTPRKREESPEFKTNRLIKNIYNKLSKEKEFTLN